MQFFCFDVIRNMLSSLRFCNCPNKNGNSRIQGRPYGRKPPYTSILTFVKHFMHRHVNGTRNKKQDNAHPRTGHKGQEGELRYICTLSLTLALDGSRWTIPCPGHFVPGKQTHDAFSMGRGGTQDWSGRAQKISPPLRIDPQNHPDCSKSTDYAILCTPTSTNVKLKNTELEHK